jgi:two-component sensor histidine kinase
VKRLIAIDLPRRLSPGVPRLATELAAAVAMTALAVGARTAITPWVQDGAAFTFTYLAAVVATLIAGWRSGAAATVMSSILVWYFVLPVRGSFVLEKPAVLYWLVLNVLTEFLIVAALGLYQSEMRRGQIERTRRINFLGHALREMDHRTRNNFQIVTSLLQLQGSRSASDDVKAALKEASERLQAVSAVYAALAPSSQGLATVRLQDQLEEICAHIRRGILPEGVLLTAEMESILVPHETGIAVGIVVNELVTNAVKHAFPDGRGSIWVRCTKVPEGARVEVADDGCGMKQGVERKGGLGTRLITAFVQRVKGRSEIRSSAEGTVFVLTVPLAS